MYRGERWRRFWRKETYPGIYNKTNKIEIHNSNQLKHDTDSFA